MIFPFLSRFDYCTISPSLRTYSHTTIAQAQLKR